MAVITKSYGLAYVKATTVGCYFANEHFDKGRFAGAVLSNDTHLFVAGKIVVEIVEYLEVVERLAYILCLENFRTYIGRFYIEFYGAIFNAAACFGFKVIEGINSRFGFGAARLRLSAHPVELGA